MLSRQTHQLLSTLIRASSRVKFPAQGFLTNSSQLPHAVTQPFLGLASYSRSFFSSSNDKDSDKKDPAVEEKEDEVLSAGRKRSNKQKVSEAAPIIIENPAEGDLGEFSDIPNLATVPLANIKLPLTEAEQKLKQETYILLSSTTPVIPYSTQAGIVKLAQFSTDESVKKMAYFMKDEKGGLFQVGLVLKNSASKDSKKISGKEFEDSDITTSIIPKKARYKIKLTEIEVKENCTLVKGIPYLDSKLTASEKEINVQSILIQIKNLTITIRQAAGPEKIDVFNGLLFDSIYSKTVDHEKIDALLCAIVAECQKITSHTKEGFQYFVQAFLEQKSLVSRLFMVKKKLEDIKGVIDIAIKGFQSAEVQVWRYHEQAKAKLSLDFIRSNYFSGEAGPMGKASQQGAQAGTTPLAGPAKDFMDKLSLIKDEVSREKVKKEIERFSMLDRISGEYHKLYTYLDEVFSIPWEKVSEEFWDIDYSKKVLEERLFGLDKVKERIVEMIAVNKLKRINEKDSEKKKGFVILLNGPPGTGKTTIAKSIAAALKRESRFISFAGVTDPAFVKGHKRTYMDAQPGIFVKELIKSKVMNPVFILDEVDKLSKHFHGVDPYYALMEILNPEENHNFTDHYLDVKVDFSQVVFILTANQVLNMLEPLRNRLEIIEVPAYIEQEKLVIAKKYLLPEVLAEHSLPQQTILFDDEAVSKIIRGWCYYESGVRELRRSFEKIARKHALEILNVYRRDNPVTIEQPTIETTTTSEAPTASESVEEAVILENEVEVDLNQEMEFVPKREVSEKIIPLGKFDAKEANQLIELKSQIKLKFEGQDPESDEMLKKYLGNPVFDEDAERKMRKQTVGTANVLTVAGFVGHVMSVECIFDLSNQDKKGVLTSSGNLEKVLQESLTIARIVAFRLLPEEKLKELVDKNVHIHFLQGGMQKDGPSAGLSICSALLSLMLNKPIARDISMTGELSLNGDVCKIGGVQAKVTASKSLGINRIILPWGNKTEFYELPDLLKEGLTVYFVKEYKEVYDIIFEEKPEAEIKSDKFVNKKPAEPMIPISHPANSILNAEHS